MKLENDWKTITAYLTYRLVPIYQLNDGITFCKVLTPIKSKGNYSKEHEGGYYLRKYGPVKKNDKVLKLRPHEANKIIGNEDLRCSKEPFIFHYGFENSPEGKYILSLIPYLFTLSPKAKRKLTGMLCKYADYVKLDNCAYLALCEKNHDKYPDRSKWLAAEWEV